MRQKRMDCLCVWVIHPSDRRSLFSQRLSEIRSHRQRKSLLLLIIISQWSREGRATCVCSDSEEEGDQRGMREMCRSVFKWLTTCSSLMPSDIQKECIDEMIRGRERRIQRFWDKKGCWNQPSSENAKYMLWSRFKAVFCVNSPQAERANLSTSLD